MTDKITQTELNAAFNMKPEEIIEFFKEKGLKTSYDWHEVYVDAHAKAFTVAKMTEIDLLKDTKKLLEKAIEEGQSYNTFKKEAMNLFQKKGWIGTRIDVDSEGNAKKVELGTPRRIKKIFDSNINAAYAAGRYREQMEEADVAPYWQYMSIQDERTRPEHSALHGKVFRADDPFWNNFYPPNGWGCRCFVRNLTKRELDRRGITVKNTQGTFSTSKVKVGGEIKEIPTYKFNDGGIERILKPDAGWETNIGKSAWGIDVQAWNKVKDMPEKIKYDFLSKMASNPHRETAYISWASQIFTNGFKDIPVEKTLTYLQPNLYEKLKETLDSPIIVMQSNQIGHSGMNKENKQALSQAEYLKIYDYINNYDEVYYDYTRPKWKQIAFIKLISGSDKCIKICVRLSQKSKMKDKDYLVSKITTIGKVNYNSLNNKKDYKRIE